MGEHLSTNIAICGGRPAIIITMSVCTTSRENRACAVVRLSNASSSLNAVHIFVRAARNSHRCEKSRRAAHSTSREVCERYINCGWNLIRLAALEGQRERDVSPCVTHRMLIESLVSALEMNDRCGCCTIDSRDIFGKPRVDVKQCPGSLLDDNHLREAYQSYRGSQCCNSHSGRSFPGRRPDARSTSCE